MPLPLRVSSFASITLIVCLFLASCRSSAAFDPRATSVDFEKGSLVLLSLRLRNDHRPDYTPHVDELHFEQVGQQAAGDTSGKRTRIAIVSAQPADATQLPERVGWYAAQLPPGAWRLAKIKGSTRTFWVSGWFSWPVDWSFELKPGEVLHLGDGVMINRTRAKHEERSGGIFPIIDQSVSGYAESTFDVTLTAATESSIASFRSHFAALNAARIESANNASQATPRP